MTHSIQAALEYWFSDLDKKIDEYDTDIVIAEIQLRALKDGLDPSSCNVVAVMREFQSAVKAHNKPFNRLKLLNDQIKINRTQLALLDGRRIAKSATQRAFLASSKTFGFEDARRKALSSLEGLEAERSDNPAYQLLEMQQQATKPKHHQFMDVEGKPDWVHIECAGGCGRFVELRKKKVDFADYYICHSVASGRQCEASIPSMGDGQFKSISFNAAGSFAGITYRWSTPAERASVERARGVLASGITSLLINKVKNQA